MRTRPDPLRHWEYFVTVAEEGSVTGAAARLGLTQSPVSQGLKRLENNIGLQLIRRSQSGAVLTGTGRALLPQARTLVRDAAQLRSTAHAIAGSLAEYVLGEALTEEEQEVLSGWLIQPQPTAPLISPSRRLDRGR